MLNDTLCRIPRSDGLQLIQPRRENLTSWRLHLPAGREERFLNRDDETVLVLQEGRGTLRAAGEAWRVSRKNVFDERATALYLPPGVELTVAAEAPLEAILISAKAESGGKPVLVRPEDVHVNHRGKGSYTREVHDIFVRDPYVRRLMIGETFNPAGNWSSYPPHKHDGRNGEPKIEEVYHYRIDPAQGFGNQMIYTNDGESVTHQVRDGDAVLVPYGYHPVSAAPGYRLYYLWGMAGEERRLALYEDPGHSWIHQS